MPVFDSFDLLLPSRDDLEKWPVIACDQFTSQPEYWQQLNNTVGAAPSALRCILPEVELESCGAERYDRIRAQMQSYLSSDLFGKYEDAFVYVERCLMDGSVRRGVVGVIDLEHYDFSADATTAIRATERTVEERIPPRMKVRRGAKIELSHVILLCDDEKAELIEKLTEQKHELEKLYDLELMQGGGRIRGWLVQGAEAAALKERLELYDRRKAGQYGDVPPMLYAVGDGNHSLATAKSCYEELKAAAADEKSLERARYAMAELENIRNDAQNFEPIHRLLTNVDVQKLLDYLAEKCCAREGYEIKFFSGGKEGLIYLDRAKGLLPVGIIQTALDAYLSENPGSIDYIHGEDALRELSQKDGSIGFEMPDVAKGDFFLGIGRDGVLPRKTFSMGHAQEKRYYLEAREL